MHSTFKIFVLLLGSLLINQQTHAQVNVALNKRASQSSNLSGNDGSPSHAVDGKTDGRFQGRSVTHTTNAGEKNPWWTVDLGEVYEISKIRIWNRTDCCAERLDNFKILVKSLPSGESWRGFVPGTQRNTGSNPLTFDGKAEGRYVMIQLVNPKGILSLAEVEVYGTKVQSNQPTAAIPPTEKYFNSGTEVAIKVDLGLWVSRCVDCQTMSPYVRNTASAHMKDIHPRNTETFTWFNYGDKVALKADNGFYLKSCYNCAAENPNAVISIEPLPDGEKEPSGNYLFTVKRLANGKFTFQSSNGRYWTRYYRGGGAKHIIATYRPSTDIGSAEFEVSKLRNVQLPIQEDEKNHVLKDVKKTMFDNFTTQPEPLRRYSYNQASWQIASIDGVDAINYHQDKLVIGRDDHVNAMTMTKSGRIVFDCSRIKTENTKEGGAIVFSSPGSTTELKRESWYVNTTAYPVKLGSTGSPVYNDRMQAVGEILMISGTDGKTKFYKILSNNTLAPIAHLSNNLNGRNFFAIAYSPVDERYFALYNQQGGTKDYSSTSTSKIEVWATEKGRSLRDPNTRFYLHYTIDNVPLSQQGAHLMVQEDGTLFLLNAFVVEPDGDIGLAGIATCIDITGTNRLWQETLALTRLWVPGTASNQLLPETWTKKIGIVPHPVSFPCIDVRPSWRYAGAFTATGASSGVVLWSSRWRSAIKDKLEKTYEYASRVLR